MRLLKICSWALILCLGVLAACSDVNDDPVIVDPEPDWSTDLTKGYSSLIIKYDTLSKAVIAVSEPVTVSNTLPQISYEQETDASGAIVLRPKVADPRGLGTVNVDQVTLTSQGDSQKSKTITVTLLRYPRQASESEVKTRLMQLLGRSMDPLAEVGVTKGAVFNNEAVAAVDGALDWSTAIQSSFIFRNEGTDYNKTVRSRQRQAGLNLSIPAGSSGFIIKPSVSITQQTVDITEGKYEYMTGSVVAECAEGQIKEDALLASNPLGFRAFLATSLNDALNNPGSSVYNKYPNDSDGLGALLNEYGTSFYTSVMLGGSANITWTKKQDFSSHSLSCVINASLSVNKTKPTEITKKQNEQGKDTLTSIINSSTLGGSGSYGYTKEDLDVMEHSELSSSLKLVGGNFGDVQDFSQWHVTDEPSKWVPIAYATKDQLNLMHDPQSPCDNTYKLRYYKHYHRSRGGSKYRTG